MLFNSLKEDSKRIKAVRQPSSFCSSLLAKELKIICPKDLGSYSWQSSMLFPLKQYKFGYWRGETTLKKPIIDNISSTISIYSAISIFGKLVIRINM